ncbi:hypothetical protein HYT05_01790 [Candidatus Kaiserbacteria bacterium]|nr:hypothetical protein [Candidatus Kaiserbacteria bacterium]
MEALTNTTEVLAQSTANDFPIWKTVTLGTHRTPDEYHKALKKAGFQIGDRATDILGKICCTHEETELDLVMLSVKELGFNDEACYRDICVKALESGLKLCPAEVGPALRLSYKDQPRGEWLRIATETTIESAGDPSIFVVGSHDHLWLRRANGDTEDFWEADDQFVFQRRTS